MRTLTRRGLLRGMATAIGLGTVGVGACTRPRREGLAAALTQLAADRAPLEGVGRAFLEERPESPAEIETRLAVELRWNLSLSRADLAARLADRIDRDFDEAKTYRVDAWILSQTEARWAALVALSGD